jgi:Bacterial TSP3 repeat
MRFPHLTRSVTLITAVIVLVGLPSFAVAKFFPGKVFLGEREATVHISKINNATKSASRVDTDRDGLSNWTEVNRTRTNPRKADTDGDGLSDWNEVYRTKTNPRNADSDGDGASDGSEITAGSDPWNPASVPGGTGPTPPPPPPTPDTTPPNTTIVTGPSGETTETSASFSFSSSESNSTYQCQLNGSSWAACGSPKIYSDLSTGNQSFSVRATDAAGNTDPTPAMRTWTVEAPDSGTPLTAVWAPPASPQASVPVTLDGTASIGDGPLGCTWSFENQDGSIVWDTLSGCKVDFTFEASGTKYVELIVENDEGDSDTNKQSFVVAPAAPAPDTTPPNTTIDSGPSGATTATTASLSFSSSESNSTFECQLDGSSWATCSSPKAYSGLKVGNHSFSVRATDTAGNTDASAATRTWTVEAGTPPTDTTPPNTTISSAPSATTTDTAASFSFTSSESGSSFECKLDSAAFGSCSSPKAYSGLATGAHTFQVRATDGAGNTDATPASHAWTVQASQEPPPPIQGCVAGATNATSTSAVVSAVSSGKDVCVTAAIGDMEFAGMGNRSGVVISTDGGGSMGHLEINGTTGLTIDSARFRSVTIRSGSHQTTIEDSTIGGTSANRVYDQLIFIPDTNNDVIIRNNDIGWTKADNTGNTGYGCRCYGTLNRLQFVGNKVHDVAGDGFQGVGGSDILIDRNEIGPVGANSDSNEHSDNIQITGNGSNLRITNNWIHHQGYYGGQVTGNAGSTYIHGGTTNTLLFENNLIESNRGRTEICGLGTGGTSRSNITIRRNTWVDGGQAYSGFPGFEWDCDSGSGNLVERNIAVDPDGGFADAGSAATFASNLWGQPSLVTLSANGDCTSANCNPAGQEPIGYRKPEGVRW